MTLNLETMMINEISSRQSSIESQSETGWIKNTSSRQFANCSLQIAHCKLKIIFILVNHFSKIKHAIPFLILLFFASCEERYWPDLKGSYQNIIVIDGMITNGLPPYTVRLSISSNVETPEYIALSGYEVTIIDELGNDEILTESENGTYMSSPEGMQGIVGRNYKILLQSPEGKTYESDYEELKEPVGIDSVYAELDYEQTETYPYNIPGYQFYIDTYTAQSDSTYLLWSMDETYKYESDYLIDFIYNGTLHIFYNSDSLKTCWYSGKVYPFFIESTSGLSEPRFTRYPLHFVNTTTRRLSVRYSLFVNQYTISKKAYDYWNGVKEQNTESGGLYYSQPYQLRGNVFNTSDPNELVLGFFMVVGVSQKRIFVNRPDPSVDMLYTVCKLSQSDYEDYGWMFVGGTAADWPLYVTEGPGGRALPNQECIDCTKKGGTLDKPDFWED